MSDSPTLSVTLLGAGQEVGRSCCVLKYRGRTVVCDAGIHPAHGGIASLPYVDELDWSTVDVLLITHFHLDHAAALTYIMEKTNFKDGRGKVYMTHPTKAIFKFLMQDFARMSAASADPLFTPLDLSLSFPSIIPISVHQQIAPLPGLTFTPYHAGHVLGACMYLIDIAGLKVLYTGDYSREEDRHLVQAELPPVRPDVLITESTYGTQSHEGRVDKEARFLNLIQAIIRRGGHALLPVYALGRAQELLLILEEHWQKHPELHNVPIYYASNLARKCMAVYQTYIQTMNNNIKSKFQRRENPFIFKHISHFPNSRGWEKKIADGPPCIVLASPGMLQSGLSRELVEMWAPDHRNGVVITGYSVEGTLARDIVNEPTEILSLKGNVIPRNCSVDYISFSAHVDYTQNSEFIDLVKAQHVILVHGEQGNMSRLRAALQHKYKERNEDINIHTPKNLETLKLNFRGERVAKVVAIGHLAELAPKTDDLLSGLLVSKDFSYTLLDPKDLKDFAGLSTSVITQKQSVYADAPWEMIKWQLEAMFGLVQEGADEEGNRVIRVMNVLNVKQTGEHQITLKWESSASNDMIADATMALILEIDRNPASIKAAAPNLQKRHDAHSEFVHRVESICMFLEGHFGKVDCPGGPELISLPIADEARRLVVHVDELEAFIDMQTLTVNCSNDSLKRRVERVLESAIMTIDSITYTFATHAPTDILSTEVKAEA